MEKNEGREIFLWKILPTRLVMGSEWSDSKVLANTIVERSVPLTEIGNTGRGLTTLEER